MFTQSERERAAYEDILKIRRDQSSLLRELREARDELREAIQQAREAAKNAGKFRLIGQIQAYQEMLEQPPCSEEKLAHLPIEELAALLAQFRKQLFPNGA